MKEENITNQSYNDIINLPHYVSRQREHMPMLSRAAQFSPFAAVVGYDGAIKETARRTDKKIELDEAEKTILDQKLRIVQEQLHRGKEITIVYFKKDALKEGGVYTTITGVVKKINRYEYVVAMQDGTKIPIKEITDITGEILQSFIFF